MNDTTNKSVLDAATTLRPGLLVSLNTSLKGNIHYQTLQLESAHVTEAGEERARWETERVIANVAEHELATRVRTKVRGAILSVCSVSAFGYLCPEDKAEQLSQAIREARELADEFNATAELTRLHVNVLYGRIAQDDVEAARAISAEIRQLMEDMQTGLATLDVKAIRDAANKARQVGEMLQPEARGRLDVAIEAARKSARQIVKAGESAAIEVDRAAIGRIEMARTAFLDIEEARAIETPHQQQRALDLEVQVGDNLYAQTPEQAAAVSDFIRTGGLDIDGEVA